MTDEITMLRIGDCVKAPTVRQFEEGTVQDISYRFEPHPKDTPFEPYLPPIPTALVNGAWHDIETLEKVTNALPERDEQNMRKDLDNAILKALGRFFSGFDRDTYLGDWQQEQMKGLSATVETSEKTSRHLYVKDGYTYEVSVRCVAWPGMNE